MASEPAAVKPVAGTNLRCLEDPVFEFERGKSNEPSTIAPASTTTTSSSVAAPSSVPGVPVQAGGYRVLEAESPPAASVTSGIGAGSSSGYHVLEAPALSPGSAQRSVASDVLEKARNRFDKFWGKGGPENQA